VTATKAAVHVREIFPEGHDIGENKERNTDKCDLSAAAYPKTTTSR